MIGFKILNEMSKEELIEEIIDSARSRLEGLSQANLLAQVINLRVEATRNSLVREAGLETQESPFGTVLVDPDEATE